MLCSVVKHLLHLMSSPVHFFPALPLPTCFTTEQSTVEASLFVKWYIILIPLKVRCQNLGNVISWLYVITYVVIYRPLPQEIYAQFCMAILQSNLHITFITTHSLFQGVTKRLSNRLGLVKRSVGLALSYHRLPDGQA